MELLADGLHFTEGPVALDNGTVLVSEIRKGTIPASSPTAPSRASRRRAAARTAPPWGRTGCSSSATTAASRGRSCPTASSSPLLDSFAIEANGNLCLATLNRAAITVVTPDGEIVDVAADDPATTNICFGGPDLRTAYITSTGRGRVYRTQWKRPV